MILSPRSDGDVYNAHIILRAFDRVADERNDITLVLLRSPADGLDLGALRHAGRVRVVGRVPHEMMADYYGAADVCVSIASSDSSPRSVWEAMACGAPCVVSDIPWVRELIEHERHALVVPIDEDAVAGALRDARQPRARRPESGVDARRLVEEHRDRDYETERLCAIYEQVAREGGRRSRLPRALGPATGVAGTAEAIVRRALTRGADQRQAGDS